MTTRANQAPTIGSKRVPAEWESQESVWLQWPSDFERVFQPAFAQMSAIISRYQKLNILYDSRADLAQATKAIAATRKRIEGYFPGRDVHIIEMLASWYDGGGVHCHTNDQPAL
jgi:agmatine/peptidylarginine deiminase